MKGKNRQMAAIVRKDIKGITGNRRMFSTLLVVPFVFAVVLPTIFILAFHFAPQEDRQLQKLLSLMPVDLQQGNGLPALAGLLLNYILPVFFLMIPIMASSVMAASSFVGEKEKRTLETLLYCPLSLKEIFRAKVAAAFLLSMGISLASFVVMLGVIEGEVFAISRSAAAPDAKWLLVMLLVSPALSLIAITLIVRGSAKAQSVEDAQQGAVFLVLPLVLLVVGQFTGVLLLSGWLLLGIGVLCAALAGLLLKRAIGNFQYEALLK